MSLPIVTEDSTVKRSFNTTRFSSGAPYTLAGTPSLHARVDGNATEVTTGFTLTADFDSKTGENQWALDLSASASYTAGAIVEVFIAAGTVDSVSVVGLKVYEFQIGTSGSLDALIARGLLALPAVAHSASGGLPTVGTSTGQISVSSGQVILQAGTGTGQLDFTSGVVKANVTQYGGSAGTFASGRPEVNTTHAAGTAWNSGAIGPNTLASDTITAAKVAADVTTELQSGLATASALSALVTTVGVAGAGLTDLGGMSTTMKGQVQTEAEDALVAHRLDELLNADSDIDGAAPPTVGSVFHELMSKTAGSFTFDQTTDSNEALRDRGDAAWTTATGFSTHTAAQVRAEMDSNSTKLAAIEAAWTTALTESYATDGATATPAQLLYMLWSAIAEIIISGTTLTCKKLDGTTTSMTFTLNDATNPTSRTRAS